MGFAAVMAIVPPAKEEAVITAAKVAGATGASVIEARGTGVKEAFSFFGLVLEERYRCIFSLVDDAKVVAILAAIKQAAEMERPGNGIAFALPISHAVGLESQLSAMHKQPPGAA
ncbi:MAG: P-II family nitrogen regulator [Deltaproteobacteria bacterium]|nr:P-II family nitrogen regulator [Deltaproteobacteria bacterium]NCP96788.1 P-II family nitrogen regulator [Deltaproteobacteria bacterium]NCS72934.1 P-II family nitrogen regulator [Deltaproteobacteria bacterium]OIP64438.1 MAG: hypothetical protein AUK30_06740 [Nitrospirae bacterium CG2_30_70_394]HBB40426.1 transcriptional regulator [Pseudomonadota bacterium]